MIHRLQWLMLALLAVVCSCSQAYLAERSACMKLPAFGGRGDCINEASAREWARDLGNSPAELSQTEGMSRTSAPSPEPATTHDTVLSPPQQVGDVTEFGDTAAGRTLTSEVRLVSRNGILMVPVSINNRITLDFVIDSGAADVSIPADVALTLVRTGTLSQDDFLGKRTYVLADGSSVPSETFRIRSLKIGGRILNGVTASISPVNSTLLLGQSFLARFPSWSINNQRRVLILNPEKS